MMRPRVFGGQNVIPTSPSRICRVVAEAKRFAMGIKSLIAPITRILLDFSRRSVDFLVASRLLLEVFGVRHYFAIA
jgi:hypothetical protein